MADSKLSALPAATTPLDGTEIYYVVQGGIDKQITNPQILSGARILLTADKMYFVSTTGSDLTGDGSVGNPWATLQHAIDYFQSHIDFCGFTIRLQLAAGTVGTPNVYAGASIGNLVGGGNLMIETSDGDPATTTISGTGTALRIYTDCATATFFGGMKIISTGYLIYMSDNCTAVMGTPNCLNLTLGPCVAMINCNDHASFTDQNGAQITLAPGASASYFIRASGASQVIVGNSGCTYTITGNPNWAVGFFHAELDASIYSLIGIGDNASGTSTGDSYDLENAGIFNHPFPAFPPPGSGTGPITNSLLLMNGQTTQGITKHQEVIIGSSDSFISGTGILTFFSSGSSNRTRFQSAVSPVERTYIFPADLAAPGGVLTDTGSGSLSWSTPISSVGGLPTATSTNVGIRRMVSDASSSPTFWGIATGSSAIVAPVVSDGTNWRYG